MIPGVIRAVATASILLLLALGAAQSEVPSDPSQVEAVIQTNHGDIVLVFFPGEAPKHVELFLKTAAGGGYDGSLIHRIIRNGIIQGGDPISKKGSEAAKDPKAKIGTGGLNLLPDEFNRHKNLAGALGAPSIPDQPNSSGVQFYICITDQPQLDGKFTIFGRVAQGMDVAAKISQLSADAEGMPSSPVKIEKVALRGRSPSAEQIAGLRGLMETNSGKIVLEFLPDAAPNSVRQFIHLAELGLYDGSTFGYVAPGYLVRGGNPAGWPEGSPNRSKVFPIWPLDREVSELPFDAGTVALYPSGADPNSNLFYFLMVLKDSPHLQGQYTVIARIVQGLEVAKEISFVDASEAGVPSGRHEITQLKIVPADQIPVLAPPPEPVAAPEPEPEPEPAQPLLSDAARQAAEAQLAKVTERPLGVPIYPAAKVDKQTADQLIKYGGEGTEAYVHTTLDSLDQLRAFYTVAGFEESRGTVGDPGAATFAGPEGVEISLASPWYDLETGAEQPGTQITIIKRPQ